MLIKLHGQFAKDYGEEFFINANTVAEAIEGFARQVEFYLDRMIEDRPLVRILGFDTDEALLTPTEQKEIHLVPAMLGGGGNFGKILIGGALIVAGVLLSPSPFGTALIGAGIGMVLGGAMGYFIKAPTVSKDNDPEASKYLGLSDNTVVIGTVIPIQYGRGPATGHVLAVNVDSSDMMHGTFPATPT